MRELPQSGHGDQPRGTRDEWQATIVAMVEKGADASDEDFNAVLDYLTKNYGHDRPGGQSAKDRIVF
jgi:hypothetical protein